MKIEEGCLAIVVDGAWGAKSRNVGKIVTVGKFIGKTRILSDSEIIYDVWEVDQPMHTMSGEFVYVQREKNLERLDDDVNDVTMRAEKVLEETV